MTANGGPSDRPPRDALDALSTALDLLRAAHSVGGYELVETAQRRLTGLTAADLHVALVVLAGLVARELTPTNGTDLTLWVDRLRFDLAMRPPEDADDFTVWAER